MKITSEMPMPPGWELDGNAIPPGIKVTIGGKEVGEVVNITVREGITSLEMEISDSAVAKWILEGS